MALIPMVVVRDGRNERSYDIFSCLLSNRIIFVTGEVEENMAANICAQILFLAGEDAEKDIHLYINSPGGSVDAGMSILDCMRFVQPDVTTTCMGLAASMGAMILSYGAKGKRFSLPNARVMIHQPSGGASGQASNIQITANEILKMKANLNRIMAEQTGRNLKEVEKAMDRDTWMNPSEAVKFGIVDRIITNSREM